MSTVNKKTGIYYRTLLELFGETQITILVDKIFSKVYTCFTLMVSSKSLLVMEK